MLAKLTTSKGEARRLMAGGGLRVNDVVVEAEVNYTKAQLPLKLSSGKKRHAMVRG